MSEVKLKFIDRYTFKLLIEAFIIESALDNIPENVNPEMLHFFHQTLKDTIIENSRLEKYYLNKKLLNQRLG